MQTISELAARWAVRANAEPLSPDEERELEIWLGADPRHRGAYVRARARWFDLDRLAALHGPANLSLETLPARSMSRRELLAASVAVITALSGAFAWIESSGGRERYTSAIGEVRRIPLSDGSTMLLNTDTEVTVRLTEQERDILLVRGEVLFEVAHDKARPFIVHADNTAVRAVGTAFAVRLQAAQVAVTVTEGVVEVSEPTSVSGSGPVVPSAARSNAQRVKANERVVIARARPAKIEPVAAPEVDRQLAWRDGKVSFDGESLQTAVSEINRHNRRQIVIDDPELGRRPVLGVFRTTDPEGFCAAAAAALKARAVADGEVIRLEPISAR
jgi:transmembrane sensor